MDSEDSIGLVQKALAGDQVALTRLVAVLTPVIQARIARPLRARRSRLASACNIHQDVEDRTQDVFLFLFADDARVLRSWQAELGLSLENFVGLVSECHVISFLRSGKRNPWKEEPSPVENLDGVAMDPNPEVVAASREQLRLLLDRLDEELSPLGQFMFQLLFVQEMSSEETMAASGLSAAAVYAWRSRLRRLARELQAEMSKNSQPARKTRKRKNGAA